MVQSRVGVTPIGPTASQEELVLRRIRFIDDGGDFKWLEEIGNNGLVKVIRVDAPLADGASFESEDSDTDDPAAP